MSQIALSPNPAGTGTFTIEAPNSNTNRTLSLPDATGTVFVSGQALSATTGSFSGDVTLGSSVLATPSGSAPSYTCRAWVNFNGTGTVAIRASGNVSSITDNGTGDYRVNFTTAMPDANYSVTGSALAGTNTWKRVVTLKDVGGTNLTASSVRVQTGHSFEPSLGDEDCLVVTVAIFR